MYTGAIAPYYAGPRRIRRVVPRGVETVAPYYAGRGRRLGQIPSPSDVTAIVEGVQDIAAAFGGGACDSGCQTNVGDNTNLLNLALAGNRQALVNLATVSGQAGQQAGIPGAGVPSNTAVGFTPAGGTISAQFAGGWGTAYAQADACQKYAQALQAMYPGTAVTGKVPTSTPATASTAGKVLGISPVGWLALAAVAVGIVFVVR